MGRIVEMKKIFINKLNSNQKILVTEEYIELLEYKQVYLV